MRVLGVSIAPRAARCLLPGTPKAEGGGPSSSAGQPPPSRPPASCTAPLVGTA
jgi:hypothetical protein